MPRSGQEPSLRAGAGAPQAEATSGGLRQALWPWEQAGSSPHPGAAHGARRAAAPWVNSAAGAERAAVFTGVWQPARPEVSCL